MANNNITREVFLGMVTAYAYAVSQGYTGTEEEFAAGQVASAEYADNAAASATAAANKAKDAEAYGTGTRAGEEVGSSDPAYHNNALYYSGVSAEKAGDSEAFGAGTRNGEDLESSDPAYENNAKYYYNETKEMYEGIPEDYTAMSEDVADLKTRVSNIEELDGVHRYGVSGLGNSSPTLTRLYDAVGMTAQVGTDGDNSSVVNGFDNVTPFNRRKCVGKWNMIMGKPVFEVEAYLGDEDYTEDGTKGDYVAVECPRAFFYMDADKLVISAHQYPGYRPFDIFCRNHDPEDTMPFYYLPAYALALDEDGHAVCLPGYDNAQGTYSELLAKAKTYENGALGDFAILQPAAVNFYEWALFTVEFATLNCQAIMMGCSDLRTSGNDRVVFTDSTHIMFQDYYASRVAGEYIVINPTDVAVDSKDYLATHKILSIIRCDSTGTESSSGTYQYAEVEDLGKDYWTYDYTGETAYRVGGRPYRTGSCNSVSTPSGSPVSNSDGRHPMKYRHRENVFASQLKTSMDLFCERVLDSGETDVYHLDWYYMPDPTKWVSGNPGASDLHNTAKFLLLDVGTPSANYASGYIKTKKYSDEFPDLWIPGETTGGSASTYFCDYANLFTSHAVRSVRFGGYWYYGSYNGFSFVYANLAPSSGSAFYGGDLCVAQ